MFVIVMFRLGPHEWLRVWSFNTFIQKCSFVRIACIIFASTSASPCSISISITLRCFYACAYVACIFNCTFVDNCSSFTTRSSSLASFCIICALTKCYSSISSSFDSSMHTKSTNVALSHVYSLTHQCHLLLCKKSNLDVSIVFMFWIIVCENCIFSLYTFPYAHSKDDDECGGNLIANGRIFNIPSLSTFLNSSSISIFLNNSTSSSYLRMCSFLYTSFSLAIRCSFSITLSTFILLWTPNLQKRA